MNAPKPTAEDALAALDHVHNGVLIADEKRHASVAVVRNYIESTHQPELSEDEFAAGLKSMKTEHIRALIDEMQAALKVREDNQRLIDAGRLSPVVPLTGKYSDVLTPFVALMEAELHANARKGDRPGWLSMSPEVALLEIYWHTAKLSAAVKNRDATLIREHSADVANMAMMLLDVCGGLTPTAPEPPK